MDGKLGLVVGLGLVLMVAVTNYPKAGPRRGTSNGGLTGAATARASDIPGLPAIPSANDAEARLDPQ